MRGVLLSWLLGAHKALRGRQRPREGASCPPRRPAPTLTESAGSGAPAPQECVSRGTH